MYAIYMNKFTQNITRGVIIVIGYCHGIQCFGNENTYAMHKMRECFGGDCFRTKSVVKISGVISNYIRRGIFVLI